MTTQQTVEITDVTDVQVTEIVEDGTNWWAVTLPNSETSARNIFWNGTNFWLTCQNGVYKSADGTNWTTVKTGNSFGTSYFPFLAGDEKFITSAIGSQYYRNF